MKHFIKYNLIGVMNTLITLASVWIMHQMLDWNLELSNFLGFIFGAINSYLMNRIWNFKSHNKKRTEVIRFIIVFLAAYALNFVTLEASVYVLNTAWCKTVYRLHFAIHETRLFCKHCRERRVRDCKLYAV